MKNGVAVAATFMLPLQLDAKYVHSSFIAVFSTLLCHDISWNWKNTKYPHKTVFFFSQNNIILLNKFASQEFFYK